MPEGNQRTKPEDLPGLPGRYENEGTGGEVFSFHKKHTEDRNRIKKKATRGNRYGLMTVSVFLETGYWGCGLYSEIYGGEEHEK